MYVRLRTDGPESKADSGGGTCGDSALSFNTFRIVRIFAIVLAMAGIGNAIFYVYQNNQARDVFMQQIPCPSTGNVDSSCAGWVVGHIIPLCSGGSEEPDNMQWQTVTEENAKAKQERRSCFPRFR